MSDNEIRPEAAPPTIPRIYTLVDAAEALGVSESWLRMRLQRGDFAALKRAGKWAMTEPQIIAAIDAMTMPASQPERYPGGLTRRSWVNLHNPRHRSQRRDPPAVLPKPGDPMPLPPDFRKVTPDSPEAIAKLPELSETQRLLLELVRRDGSAVVDGRRRRTVEELARRGLVDYDAQYVLNDNANTWIYRIDVRPR